MKRLNETAVPSAAATWVPMADFFAVTIFATESDAAVTLVQATDASGTGSKALKAGTGSVDAQVDEMDAAGGFTHVSGTVTGTGSPTDTAEAVVLRNRPRYSV